MKKDRPIYTIDLETDPFEYGKEVQPFACGLYDGQRHWQTWGPDCVSQMVAILEGLPAGLVYAHNGGRFDFFWFLRYGNRQKNMVIIKNRIVKFTLETGHEMRDSFKLFPFALEKYQKTKIDYNLFRTETREQHKEEILSYLIDDCRYLWEMVKGYFDEFGESLTIGSTAFSILKGMYDVGDQLSPAWDDAIRSTYYFGGRVERYDVGVFKGDFSVFDINSAYPYVMRDFRHPIGEPHYETRISDDSYFVKVIGHNKGAFPQRTKMGLRFDVPYGEFAITIHEFNEAVFSGKFICEKIVQTLDFERSLRFDEYINKYYGMRVEADARGEQLRKLMFKFLLNNSYGKFAINPANYKDYMIASEMDMVDRCECPEGQRKCECGLWSPVLLAPEHGLVMYARTTRNVRRMNIATGASITGATRSILMRGLSKAVRPMYCDTDSIIAEGLDMELDASKLGAFKLEGTGDKLAIAGRKMYALFAGDACLKYASKGVHLTPAQIISVAQGEKVQYNQDAPVFGLDGSVKFISREARIV